MFATRNHDENAIYDQQTTAAAKSLNQGVKGLAPKTPGAKTPFRSRSHDENVTYGPGKTGGKEAKKGDAFVTPAGPRNRAPLGNKTTNARALAPKPVNDSVKNQSARHSSPQIRRAKVKVHQADPLSTTGDDEYPEIEHMPPREIPLPDPPEDVTKDEFPELRGKNFTRGWWMIGAPEPLTEEQEQEQWRAKYKLAEEREKRAEEAKKKASVSTLKAKDAASALAAGIKPRPLTSKIIPKTRKTSSSVQPEKQAVGRPTGPSHTTARAVSKTTLGYAKGRSVSASRPQLSQVHARPQDKPKQTTAPSTTSPFKPGTNLHDLLMMQNLGLDSEEHEQDNEEATGGVLLDLNDEIDALLPPDCKLGPVEE